MGTFDYVNYEAPCPICARLLTDWQTKDRDEMERACDRLKPAQVTRFHALCDRCEVFVTINIDTKEARHERHSRIIGMGGGVIPMVSGFDYCQTCHRDVPYGDFRRLVLRDPKSLEFDRILAICAKCQALFPTSTKVSDIPKEPGSAWRAAHGGK